MKIESEQTKRLPISWKGTVLGAVLYLKNGFAFKSNSYQEVGTPVIRISDIQDGIVTTKSSIKIKASEEFNDYLVHKDDILIAMSGATTGKYGVYKQKELAYQNQRVGNFRLYSDDLINKKFIFFLLNCLKRKIEIKAYGGAQPNISGKNIESLKFLLPPLPEQHQIVAKIEELFSELDNGIENLKKAREQLKTYRQAVLKYAFEGRLTKEWRTQQIQTGNPPEPAEKLLERIRKELEKACEQAKKEGKKKPAKPKKPKELPLLSEKELAELSVLPEGWTWMRFGQIVHDLKRGPFGSAIKKEFFVPKGLKVYEQKNAIYKSETIGDYFISDEKFKELSGFEVHAGDYIVSCSGTIGKIYRLPENSEKGVINQALLRINISEKLLDHVFFQNLFESTYFQTKILKDTKGSAMVNLAGIKELKLVPFAYCSLKEQEVIGQ